MTDSLTESVLFSGPPQLSTTSVGNGTGNVTGPGASTGNDIATWSGSGGAALLDSGKAFSTDGTLAGNSDALSPTQKAVKTYVDATAFAGIPALTDGTIWIGNATNVATPRTLSGDVTTTDTGVTAIGAGKVTPAMLSSPSGTGASVLISEVVTSGSQGNVTFSSIAATYRDLELRVRGRGDDAGADVAILLQFNGDTGGNYDYEQTFGGSSTTNVQQASQTSMWTVQIAGGGSAASFSGAALITVFDYKGTTFYKHVCGNGGENRTGSGERALMTSGQWRSTAAINAIKVFFNSGNFVDGSVVSLYGNY